MSFAHAGDRLCGGEQAGEAVVEIVAVDVHEEGSQVAADHGIFEGGVAEEGMLCGPEDQPAFIEHRAGILLARAHAQAVDDATLLGLANLAHTQGVLGAWEARPCQGVQQVMEVVGPRRHRFFNAARGVGAVDVGAVEAGGEAAGMDVKVDVGCEDRRELLDAQRRHLRQSNEPRLVACEGPEARPATDVSSVEGGAHSVLVKRAGPIVDARSSSTALDC